jgi:pyruvate kinase
MNGVLKNVEGHLLHGVSNESLYNTDDILLNVIDEASKRGLVQTDDTVVVVSGRKGLTCGSTSSVRVFTV